VKDVYVSEAAIRLDITYISGDNRNLSTTVNGAKARPSAATPVAGARLRRPASATPERRFNVVRLYKTYAWMPDIDCMTSSCSRRRHPLVVATRPLRCLSPSTLPGQHMGTAPTCPRCPTAST
jgi:hypothetical protein